MKIGRNANKKRIEQYNRGVWLCNECHQELPFDAFCTIDRHWSGLDYKCRECSTKRRNAWKRNNRFKHRANDMNRRASVNFVTGSILREIYHNANRKCFYCGIKVDITKKHSAHFDHVIPGLNESSNIVLSCFKCNTLKSDGTLEDFENFVEKIKIHLGNQDS